MKNSKSCLELVEESKEKFRKFAENSLVGMFIYKEHFVYVNDAFVKMTGYSTKELLRMHPWDLADRRNKLAFKNFVARRLKGEMFTSVHNNGLLVKKDGTKLPVKISAETIEYQDAYAGIGMAIDISDIVEKEQMIEVLVQALSQSDDIVFITDDKGVIQYTNEALLKIYNYELEEIIGKKPSLFGSGKHERSFFKELWETILHGYNYHDIIINKKKNGEIIYVDTKITPVKDHITETISFFTVTAREVTNNVLREQKFEKLATIDHLTQISNRYQINKYFDDFIARANREKRFFSLLLFDIDHFKKINDNYGHHIGDIVLQLLSELIVNNIREVDKFGRWGGEEFLLLLENTQEHAAMQIAQKLNSLIAKTRLAGLYCITVSIGVTEYRFGEKKESCMERADRALYAAKNLGRNRVVFT